MWWMVHITPMPLPPAAAQPPPLPPTCCDEPSCFTSHWRPAHTHMLMQNNFHMLFEAIILNLIMYPHSLMLQIHTFNKFRKVCAFTASLLCNHHYNKRFILATSVWNNLFSNKIKPKKRWKKKKNIFQWITRRAKTVCIK